MCLTYPGLVLEVGGDTALIALEGRERRASIVLVPEVKAGDWVLVAVGTVLEILDAKEAQEIVDLLDGDRHDGVSIGNQQHQAREKETSR